MDRVCLRLLICDGIVLNGDQLWSCTVWDLLS